MTNKALSVADLQTLVTSAEADVAEAQAQWEAAKDKLDQEHSALSIAADMAAIAELRKAIKQALEAFETARDDHGRLTQQLHQAQQAEETAHVAKRIEDAKHKGQLWQSEIETLQELLQKVAAQYETCAEAGLAFRTALPNQIGESELTMLWSPATLAQNAQLFLYGVSGGRFSARSTGSPWMVVQGPDLKARARENIQRALAKQPKMQREPTPPRAA